MSEKGKGLLVNCVVYIVAFGIGMIPFLKIPELFTAEAAFTVTATLVIYLVSVFYKDTSLYDPYWSAAPPVMLLIAMIRFQYWNTSSFWMLLIVCVWSVRLTGNWAVTYRGLGREDWRYARYRKKLNRFSFELLNLFGFMLMPTIVVYAGLSGAFYVIQKNEFDPAIFQGIAIMLAGIFLEYKADTAIHRFLKDEENHGLTCRISVWKYSRHPNYLGEMLFWIGIYIAFAALYPEQWTHGLGFLLIIGVFVFASIPKMERHNLERRADYPDYQARTAVLVPLPRRKKNNA